MITGASLVGVGGGETGDGNEAGQGVELLEDCPLRSGVTTDGVLVGVRAAAVEVELDERLEVDEQSDPHLDPDSLLWLSM